MRTCALDTVRRTLRELHLRDELVILLHGRRVIVLQEDVDVLDVPLRFDERVSLHPVVSRKTRIGIGEVEQLPSSRAKDIYGK